MLGIVSSLVGFGSAFAPKLLDFFQDKQDKAHELKVMAQQAALQREGHAMKLEAITVEAAAKEIEAAHKEQATTVKRGSRWLANLSGSIRPVVTYLFVIEFLVINWAIAFLLISQEGITLEALREILDDEYMALLTTMIAFWFGSREVRRREGKL